jgi:flagellar L-ring protein FlgH
MRYRDSILILCLAAFSCQGLAAAGKKAKPSDLSPLDRYIQEASSNLGVSPPPAPAGSLWSLGSRLTDLGSDLRASQVNDLVTILVSESASAVAQGSTKTQRQSSAKAAVTAAAGVKNPVGTLANLANAASATQLDGQGTTSRTTQLSTSLSARVTHVLPNGYLVVQGSKETVVNSERQVVTVRGVVRPTDLSASNVVRSDQIAQMELKINGKGVVADAVRRPFILYRILLGLLPF